MTETIAVFGATGGTGSQIVKFALEQGYKVQALARTQSKLQQEEHPTNLTVIPGDFENMDAARAVVKGADYVIVCAGGNVKQRPYTPVMGPFITKLWPILENETSIKVFLYQAGALAMTPGQKTLPFSMKMMKYIADCFINLSGMVADNQDVIDFINTKSHNKPFNVIVTLPGVLKQGESSGKEYHGGDKPSMDNITFTDLAIFTLKAIKDNSLYGKYPYPVPKK